MKLFLASVLAAGLAFAQSDSQTGAKALFFNAESGATAKLDSPANPSKNIQTHHATGLKFSIELKEQDGTLRPVEFSRVFHTGERIRIHVSTNVDGNVVIYQKQDNEEEERLFPSPKLPDATGHVKKNADIVLPSNHGWFVFDDRPGQIHLTLLLRANSQEPIPNPDSNAPLQLASAESAHQVAAAETGSKALVVEDDTGDDKAKYAVVAQTNDGKIPAGTIAMELMLSHAR